MSRDSDPHDPRMNSFGTPTKPALLRSISAMVLLAFGVGVAIWILVSLVGLLSAQVPPALVGAVTPGSPGSVDPIVFGFPEGDFTIPADVFKAVGYLIVCLVYMVAVGLAISLINGGVALLQPDMNKTLRKLVELLEKK